MTPPPARSPLSLTWSPGGLSASAPRKATPRSPRLGAARLEVTRTDIRWRNVTRDVVRLEVTVHNRGDAPSRGEVLQINAAPLGAFVKSTPVAQAKVPPIQAGGSWRVRRDFADPRAARGSDARRRLPALPDSLPRPSLRPQTRHWAGNFDVFVHGTEAERHRSDVVRLQDGRVNLAMFVVGCGPDHYRFSFDGEGASWGPRILACGLYQSMLLLGGDDVSPDDCVTPDKWHRWTGQHPVILGVTPPRGTTSGGLSVLVEQKSSRKVVPVEFGFGEDTVEGRCFRE